MSRAAPVSGLVMIRPYWGPITAPAVWRVTPTDATFTGFKTPAAMPTSVALPAQRRRRELFGILAARQIRLRFLFSSTTVRYLAKCWKTPLGFQTIRTPLLVAGRKL